MGRTLLIDAVVAGGIACVWYALFTRYNRRRGSAVLAWVQAACLGKGSILNPEWRASSSLLQATLNLSSRWFEDIRLTVRLMPRPLPLHWFLRSYGCQKETLTFEADMGFPPAFHLDVVRHRWSGHTGGKSYHRARAWNIRRPGPIVLTTKDAWPAELSAIVNALTSRRDMEFMSVRFDPRSPHFTATVALKNLSDQKSATALLGLFRELAASSSAKQH